MNNLSGGITSKGKLISGGITSKGKLNGSLAIGKIGGTVDCKKNVYVGEMPQEYTEVWFDPSEEGIIDEVATKKFVEERTVKLETSLEQSVKFKVVGEGITVPPINGEGSYYDDTEIREMINEVNTSLDNLENEVNELKDGNIDIDLTNYATKTDLSLKVDKETGKSLISDDEIERLSTLKNYDDTNILLQLNDIENEVNELKEGNGNIDIDLTNYVTKSELSTKADKTELHSHSNKDVLDGITTNKIIEWNNKSTFDGNYNSLANKPTIPTKTSQLTNDSGFITSIPSEYITETELNEVVKEIVETKVNEILGDNIDEIIGETLNESLTNIAEYNVKNYGAKGDGVTDDTNAIISAINDFKLSSGNKLIFPSGSYKITSPLLIDLNNNRFMSIEMNGYILPASGIGSCISLINGANVNAIIKVKGGTDVTGLGCGLYMSAISGLMLTMYTEDIIGIGCKIVNCNQSNINIISTGCDTALSIDGLTESNVNINSKNDKNICYVSSSTNSVENVNFNIIGKDTQISGFETSKGNNIIDSISLTGKFNKVIVDNKDVYLDIVNSHIRDISLPRSNKVRVSNNRYGKFSGSDPDDKTFCA